MKKFKNTESAHLCLPNHLSTCVIFFWTGRVWHGTFFYCNTDYGHYLRSFKVCIVNISPLQSTSVRRSFVCRVLQCRCLLFASFPGRALRRRGWGVMGGTVKGGRGDGEGGKKVKNKVLQYVAEQQANSQIRKILTRRDCFLHCAKSLF